MKYRGKITDPKDLVTKEYVDTGLSGKLGTSGDGSNVTAAFTAASSRTNISTGEKLTVIFGKIAKWFADLGAAAFRGVDSVPTDNSTNLVESGGVKSAITHDLANIVATGTTNTTGAVIASGTYFYLNGTLARAKADIAVNATFTSGTNYEAVTAGGLNSLKSAMVKLGIITGTTGENADLQFGNDLSKVVVIAAFPERTVNTDSYNATVATNSTGTTQFCRVLDGYSHMMTNAYVKIWYAYIEI